MTTWNQYLKNNEWQSQQDLIDLVKIPSISAQEEHVPDVIRAAEWVGSRLAAAGVENVRFIQTGGHRAVYADWLHAPEKPTLLIYGHFDVQPADPLELWDNPPFEPVIKDDRLYGRGASDSKANVLEAVLAVDALIQTTGVLPVNVKFLFEGQEEVGSPDLPDAVRANEGLLSCDFLINSDSVQFSETEPALLIGGRGIAVLEVNVQGPKADLHSGVFGGGVQNPIHALTQLLASLHNSDGKVTVPGFYDDVIDPPVEELANLPPSDDDHIKAVAGVNELFGEPGFTTYQRTTARPTIEINGIWGGYQGQGAKTIIPSSAHAKITSRLVANQVPSKIASLIKDHIEKNRPVGVDVEVIVPALEAYPFSSAINSKGNEIAAKVLTKLYGRSPYCWRVGGSIPVLDVFQQVLGQQAVSFGFGQEDENIHSPNEFVRLSNFHRGQHAFCWLLEAFAVDQE